MAKIITVTSGKGGVGKTTTSINLGAALNAFGKEVIVVDANLTTPNVGLHLGAPLVPVSLNHVLLGKARLNDAIYEHESGTKVVPGSLSAKELRKLNNMKLNGVGKKLKKLADYIIFDCAAGLGQEAINAFEASDELIIVTNPDIPSVTDALKTAKVAEDMGKEVRGVIVSRVKGSKTEMSIDSIRDMLELPILGVVPEDDNMPYALLKKDAIMHTHPNSKSAKAYRRIAAKIAGKADYKEAGFWERVFQAIGI